MKCVQARWNVVCLALAVVGTVSSQEPARNEPAIAEVAAGTRKVAHAAWWGFDADDSTAALQAAINSGAEKVVVEKMPSPWIVGPIELAGDQEVFFEPGAVVLAKKGEFRGTGDCLFTAWNKSNLRLTGPGATLRMHRSDYDSPDYRKAEWRHALSLRGCTDVTVTGLTLAESGGDGIYLGAGRGGEPNRGVTIRGVVCDRNYRQGISVITAENLLVEDCTLRNTAGTPPAAGIDFEPNAPTERLVNCVMRRCVIEDNQGYALHIYAAMLDGTSTPVSIRVEECVTRGKNALSASVITSCGEAGPVKGSIEFVDCRFEDEGRAGLRIGSKPPSGAALRFVRCTVADLAEPPQIASPIVFSTGHGDREGTGGVEFADFTIRNKTARPPMKFDDALGSRLVGVTGTLIIEQADRPTVYRLDQALVDRWFPFDPLLAVRPVMLEGLRLEPADAATPRSDGPLTPHRVRDEATFVLFAGQDDSVSYRLAYEQVGRYSGNPLEVRVIDPAGRQTPGPAIELGQQAEARFTAAQPGLYQIECRPGQNTARMVSCSHPVSIAGPQGSIHLLGTTGGFSFWAPAGPREFGLRVKGEGDAERVSARLLDASGRELWAQADVAEPQSFLARRDESVPSEVWRNRPTQGVLEDCYLEFHGLPALLALRGDGVLRPADSPP